MINLNPRSVPAGRNRDPDVMPPRLPDSLVQAVADIVPQGTLSQQVIPGLDGLELALISDTYPQHALDDDAVQRIMNNPLYWVFCWASGRVLARYLLDRPELVRGGRVLDFGAGSGVVAIAAALAGASEVIACDLDADALTACEHNARCNGVDVSLCSDFASLAGSVDLILAADVLYDRENLDWLARFRERATRVLVADSRIRDFDFPPYRRIDRQASSTIPDLDESPEFRTVTIYEAVS